MLTNIKDDVENLLPIKENLKAKLKYYFGALKVHLPMSIQRQNGSNILVRKGVMEAVEIALGV